MQKIGRRSVRALLPSALVLAFQSSCTLSFEVPKPRALQGEAHALYAFAENEDVHSLFFSEGVVWGGSNQRAFSFELENRKYRTLMGDPVRLVAGDRERILVVPERDPSTFHAYSPSGMRLFAQNVGGNVESLISDGTYFFASGSEGVVRTGRVTGPSTVFPFVRKPGNLSRLVADVERVFFLQSRDGAETELWRSSKPEADPSGDPTRESNLVLSLAKGTIESIVVDNQFCVFFVDPETASIQMVWKDGSEVIPVANKLGRPSHLVFFEEAQKLVWWDESVHALYQISSVMENGTYGVPQKIVDNIYGLRSLLATGDGVVWSNADALFRWRRAQTK